MVDYRDEYFERRPTVPYDDVGNNSYVGPIIALIVVALFMGSIFFFSSGPQTIDGTGPAPATSQAPAAEPATPAVPAE